MVSLWWEEVDSYKSESERACTHSEASSTERWFRIHPNMRKRWIASALGKFVYKLRNATKGITRICKVNNGAVAVCNGANGCFATVLHPLSFAQKKKASEFRCFLFWWEEVDSFNSGTGKFTCISGASAPKQVVQAQRAARCIPRRIHDSQHKKKTPHCDVFFLVGRGGFEPPKAVPTDLQSAPFGHSGIFPRLELVVGVEPTTC